MSQKLSEKWDYIGREILGTARNELYLNMRYLDLALCSLRYQMDTAAQTAGTDGYRIYFEPYGLSELYQRSRKGLNRLYLHMVFHCLFRHLTRRGDRQEDYWNLAADIAVESLIDGLEKRSVRQAVSPERQVVYRELRETLAVLTAEGVYHVLVKKGLKDEQLQKLKELFLVDDHQFWPHPDSDTPPEAMEALENRWQDIAERTETEADTFGQEETDGYGSLTDQLKLQNRRRQDYRGFLRKFSVWREEMQVDTDSFDYGFYSYGLRLYGNMPLVEPQEYKEVKKIQDFVIAIDTSGSTSGELVQRFVQKTYNILKSTESFFSKINLHIIQCDAAIQVDQKITCQRELDEYLKTMQLYGLGGTDFRPVFEYVEALRKNKEFQNLKGLIYFTDGHGTFPAKKPDFDTAFVFVEDDYNDPDVPPWAIKLVL